MLHFLPGPSDCSSSVLHWTHCCHRSATTLKFPTGEANNIDHFVPVQRHAAVHVSLTLTHSAKHWCRPSTWKADASPSRTMCQRLLRNSKDATRSPKNWPCFHSTNSKSYQVFGYNSGTSMIHRAPHGASHMTQRVFCQHTSARRHGTPQMSPVHVQIGQTWFSSTTQKVLWF